MAASVLNLIESLEAHLERTQQELERLREENARLRRQLAQGAAPATSDLPAAGESQVASSPMQAATEKAPAQPTPKRETSTQQAPAQEPPGQSPSVQAPEVQEREVSKAEAAGAQGSTNTPPSPHALLKQWYERYPNAFFKGHTKPLKVGIHQDLAQREPWSSKLIRRALANYVNLPRYVKSMREGAERVDLDGMPAGKVDKEASLHANERRKDQTGEKSGKPASKQAQKKAPQHSGQPPQKQESAVANPPRQRRSESEALEKSDERKPLSLEEKIKGLMQKFEGR